MNQRGSLLIYGVIALFVAAAGATFVLTYKSAIARAEKAEAQKKATQAKFDAFVADTKRLGQEAQKKSDREMERQKGVSNAKIKSLEGRIAATRAQFAKLRDGRSGSGSGDLPPVPIAAKPVDDSARDNQLRAVLQHAQEQADRLIELQSWVREQEKSPGKPGP